MAFVIGNANKMLLLFEIKALIDRIVCAWKLKLGKISHATLPKGLTVLFIFTCHSNLSKWTTKKND